MLYTIFGTDIEKVRARSRALTATLQAKRPDASFFRLHLENFDSGRFTELLGSVGLFSNKYIVLLDNLLTGTSERKDLDNENSVPNKLVNERLADLKKSEHVWIIVEDALFGASTGKELGVKQTKELVDLRKELEKMSDKMEVHDTKLSASKADFKNKRGADGVTSFTFTDAFFDKDKIRALNALTMLKKQEIAPEEIHGALWWQTKAMFQVAAGDAKKLSPFVSGKCSRFLKKWNSAQLAELSNHIIESYHQAHLGKTDLDDEFMKMVLSLK